MKVDRNDVPLWLLCAALLVLAATLGLHLAEHSETEMANLPNASPS